MAEQTNQRRRGIKTSNDYLTIDSKRPGDHGEYQATTFTLNVYHDDGNILDATDLENKVPSAQMLKNVAENASLDIIDNNNKGNTWLNVPRLMI